MILSTYFLLSLPLVKEIQYLCNFFLSIDSYSNICNQHHNICYHTLVFHPSLSVRSSTHVFVIIIPLPLVLLAFFCSTLFQSFFYYIYPQYIVHLRGENGSELQEYKKDNNEVYLHPTPSTSIPSHLYLPAPPHLFLSLLFLIIFFCKIEEEEGG